MDDNKRTAKQVSSVGALSGSALLADKIRREGYLDGRKKLYHNTDKVNINSILENGLKAKMGDKEDSFTSSMMRGNGIEDLTPFKNKTYLATKKSVAEGVGARKALLHEAEKNPFLLMANTPTPESRAFQRKHYKTLEASVPFDDFQKLKKVKNPELRGMTPKEFADFLTKGQLIPQPGAKLNNYLAARSLDKDTVTLEGDFASKYFKKGKGYIKNSPKQVAKYVAKHPGRFGKGLLAGAGVAGLAGLGVKNIHDLYVDSKQANLYMDAIEKVASMYDMSEAINHSF